MDIVWDCFVRNPVVPVVIDEFLQQCYGVPFQPVDVEIIRIVVKCDIRFNVGRLIHRDKKLFPDMEFAEQFIHTKPVKNIPVRVEAQVKVESVLRLCRMFKIGIIPESGSRITAEMIECVVSLMNQIVLIQLKVDVSLVCRVFCVVVDPVGKNEDVGAEGHNLFFSFRKPFIDDCIIIIELSVVHKGELFLCQHSAGADHVPDEAALLPVFKEREIPC